MEYKNTVDVNIEGNVLDGEISVDTAVEIVSKLTGIELSVLRKGAAQYSFVEVIENPLLLEITEEQRETLQELRSILDYKTGVEEL